MSITRKRWLWCRPAWKLNTLGSPSLKDTIIVLEYNWNNWVSILSPINYLQVPPQPQCNKDVLCVLLCLYEKFVRGIMDYNGCFKFDWDKFRFHEAIRRSICCYSTLPQFVVCLSEEVYHICKISLFHLNKGYERKPSQKCDAIFHRF